MTDREDLHDAFRHRNLERMGRELTLPAEPDAQREERWKLSRPPASQTGPSRTVRFVQRHKPMALLTGGAAAAAVTFAVWLGVGGSTPVSAATILHHFKMALTEAVTIRIEGVDLGNVTIDGEIIFDRATGEPNEKTDTFYSELHVVLKADNPDWNDLDGAIVVCQSPTQAWVYCRGNGGSGGGLFAPRRVRPTEYLAKGTNWPGFVKDPLGHFGAMPLQLTFYSWNSRVRYRFLAPQRAYVRQLLHFLLDLSSAETVEGLIAELQAAAGRTSVTRVDETTWVMHASNFGRIGSLEPPQPKMPDVEALLKDVVWELNYDVHSRSIVGWSTTGGGTAELSKLGIGVDQVKLSELDLPTESADALIKYFEDTARKVEVDRSSWLGRWKIRVTGYPLPLETSGRDWAVEIMPKLMRGMELSVYFDAEAGTVRRAEFRNIASPGSRITLELGQVKLDPARLEPDRWVTEYTTIYESSKNP